MSNPKPRPVAEINLEEFERRLRASAGPQAGVEDPLAELTRLVDTIGFDRTPAEKALEASRPAKVEPPAPAPEPELRLSPAPEPVPPPTEATIPPPSPRPEIDLSELEAAAAQWSAAPPLKDAEPALRPAFDGEDLDSLAFDPPTPSVGEARQAPRVAAPSFGSQEPPARARNWGLKVGGLIGAAAVMLGAVVVFKVGGHKTSGAPPLILASTAPTKVAPPNEETIRTANETGALLTRDTAQPTQTPPKLVNPPEAPVDLAARPQPAPSANAEAEASPVAPSANTPIVATPSPSMVAAPPASADPNRVKTISVRPDGSLIASGYAATEPTPAPIAPAPASSDKTVVANADGEAASPAVALPTKLAPPKTSARVVSKTETTAPPDAGAGPVPVAPKPKKPKPTPTPVAEAEPPKTDDATAPPAPGGGYAVQLAAPRSESEAKALVRSLPGRYSEALSGASLGVRKAERDGEAIYRVRAMGLSKAEAAAMCSKVKAAGGDCYVAKN